MKENLRRVLITAVAALAAVSAGTENAAAQTEPAVWHVDDVLGEGADNPAEDFATIQAAIDAASAGDTIIVHAGTYRESIVMKSGVKVEGAGSDASRIEWPTNPAVKMSDISGFSLSGFTVETETSGNSVVAERAAGTISGCRFVGGTAYIAHCGLLVENNRFECYGIHDWHSGSSIYRNNLMIGGGGDGFNFYGGGTQSQIASASRFGMKRAARNMLSTTMGWELKSIPKILWSA